MILFFFFFQAEDGIRDYKVTGVQTCALPISPQARRPRQKTHPPEARHVRHARRIPHGRRIHPLRRQLQRDSLRARRSEEHTSELQSPCNLVCRLLLEKKKKKN